MSKSRMRDNQASNAMQDTTFSRRDMLWAGGVLTVGAAFAEPSRAAAAEPSGAGPEPTSWVDSAMPEVTHRMIETNGIRLHVAEQGEGPLIILCHGFPECWYSWRHQLPALAKAGFRAVAPDLRGYGRSDRPEEVEKYTILHDIGDIVGLELPFDDGRFNVVLLQHVAMNISDRTRLYREIRRVLKSGGRFASFDVVLNSGEPHFPLPWARTPATSCLLTATATREAIEPAGFRNLAWQDDTEVAKAWAAQLRVSGPPPSPNLGVVMGPEFAQLAANLGRNLMEGRLGILTAVFEAAPTNI
jgi:SAM-dependent methyltransferase